MYDIVPFHMEITVFGGGLDVSETNRSISRHKHRCRKSTLLLGNVASLVPGDSASQSFHTPRRGVRTPCRCCCSNHMSQRVTAVGILRVPAESQRDGRRAGLIQRPPRPGVFSKGCLGFYHEAELQGICRTSRLPYNGRVTLSFQGA